MRLETIVILVIILFVGGFFLNAVGVINTDLDDQILSPSISAVEKEIENYIYNYTNTERATYGLSSLQYDPVLSDIARSHSLDMATNNYFSHTNLQGFGPSDRAEKAGYSTYKSLGDGWYTNGIGENIFKMPYGNVEGVGYVGKYDSNKIAYEIVDGWMNSPGHRANILESDYTKIGVGVSYNDGYYYATQDFW
ncbi:MAG TPA: CAP domain-containing protein [Methanocorpusculum sp.]|nr:CAP domain-containing protein [Methanocorpusculum sp.]